MAALLPLLLLLQGSVPATSPGARAPEHVTRELWVMGTRLRLEVTGSEASRHAERALRELERMDALLTTWQPGPMELVNGAPVGRTTPPDAALAPWLAEAERWARRTGRAFDAGVGALIDAWGVRDGGHTPSERELAAARAASGPAALSVDPESGAVTRSHPDAWIDTGGFGKGAALRALRDAWRERLGPVVVAELGGQLLILGAGAPRAVSVAHPVRRGEAVAELRVSAGSVATSGLSERPGHILDPRTGRPAPAWGSVTVAHPDPMVADVLSTALYVMGPDEGLAWAQREGVAALFLTLTPDGLESSATSPMREYIR